jgi:hypothetical protein
MGKRTEHSAAAQNKSPAERSASVAHTPGPWRTNLRISSYRSGTQQTVVEALRPDGIPQTIATVVAIDAANANARLIAAAPELLDALINLTRETDFIELHVLENDRLNPKGYRLHNQLRQAKAVLAKAKGDKA